MARTSEQKQKRKDAIKEYRALQNEKCEIAKWMKGEPSGERWIENHQSNWVETHHICGRGRSPKHEWHCNLIVLSCGAHKFVEKNVIHGQIICLYAKYRKHLSDELNRVANGWDEKPESELEWNPDAVNGLVAPWLTLAGRLDYLINKSTNEFYANLADEMLRDLNETDVLF